MRYFQQAIQTQIALYVVYYNIGNMELDGPLPRRVHRAAEEAQR